MSRRKFLKETDDCFYWRQKNNLPVHKNIFDIDKYIRDKWIAENRHGELISYILDEWDNGDFNDHTDFIEEYELTLLQNKKSKEFIKLWKGILNIRLERLWHYIKACETNSNQFITKDPARRLNATIERQKFALKGIDRFTKGLLELKEVNELEKVRALRVAVKKLEHPKPHPTTDKRKIDERLFWELIDNSRKESEDKYSFLNVLKARLEKFKHSEIRNFGKQFLIKFNELNTWDNWALVYIARNGCGDDEFDYFKSWVISMGQNVFNTIKAFQVEKFQNLLTLEEPQFEEFMSVTESTYEFKANELMKPIKVKSQKLLGKEWNESTLENEYPELCKIFDYRDLMKSH